MIFASLCRQPMRRLAFLSLAIGVAQIALTPAASLAAAPVNLPPAPAAWTALASLPDWSGVWVPNVTDQIQQMATNPPPWTSEAAQKIQALVAAEKAGAPKGLFIDCLPEGMPSWMLISHNSFEALFTPGRVTFLGESDANRLRRIYTDGRAHQPDPDPSFHGESIGHWQGDTLVIDTIGVLPEVYLAVSEAVGLPNDGDLHVVERIHLAGPDILHDDLEITAPHILAAPWKTTRIYYRQRTRQAEIIEGVCLQGAFKESKDAAGDAVFQPRPQVDGNPVVEDRPNPSSSKP